MRGEKKIDLGFDISYSMKGQFVTTRTITVREPGLGKYEVWSTMKSFVMQAQPGIFEVAAKAQAAASAGVPAAEESDDPQPESEDDTKDILSWMAIGLGEKKFNDYMRYVKAALTNAPKLATVGDSEQPITDEVWEALDEKGGMTAVTNILSEFTGFFFGGQQKSAKTNGGATSPSSPSPPQGTSPTGRRATSRLPN